MLCGEILVFYEEEFFVEMFLKGNGLYWELSNEFFRVLLIYFLRLW